MIIRRREYVRCTNEYNLEITERYLADLTDYVNKEIVDPEDHITLTEKDIADIVNCEWENWRKSVRVRPYYQDEEPITVVLADFIMDIIDQDIWDCDFTTWDSDSDGYDTEVMGI